MLMSGHAQDPSPTENVRREQGTKQARHRQRKRVGPFPDVTFLTVSKVKKRSAVTRMLLPTGKP